jgi:hypothetical protein
MENVRDVPFDDDEDWRWSLDVQAGPVAGLVELRLSVVHSGQHALAGTSYQLTRYVRHPDWFRSREVRPTVRNSPAPQPEAAVKAQDTSSDGDRDR